MEILVSGGRPEDKIELGLGLTKLPQETLLIDREAGVLGTWGSQTPEIGTIGMGIVFPSHRFLRVENLPDENRVVLRVERNVPFHYHIQCDWLRGRHVVRNPSADDWLNDLRSLAIKVNLQ